MGSERSKRAVGLPQTPLVAGRPFFPLMQTNHTSIKLHLSISEVQARTVGQLTVCACLSSDPQERKQYHCLCLGPSPRLRSPQLLPPGVRTASWVATAGTSCHAQEDCNICLTPTGHPLYLALLEARRHTDYLRNNPLCPNTMAVWPQDSHLILHLVKKENKTPICILLR